MPGRMGKHYGAFAKGFMDSLLAVMRMQMMMEYYKSREGYLQAHEDHWKAMEEIARAKGVKGMMPPAEAEAAGRERAGWGQGTGDAAPTEGAREAAPAEAAKVAEVGPSGTGPGTGGRGGGAAPDFAGASIDPKTADVAHLNPAFADRLSQMLTYAKSQGIDARITQGYRSYDDQARIYNSGVRPAAAPGHSYHEFGNAADVYAVDRSKQKALDALASRFGLYSGSHFGDSGHFQIGDSNIPAAEAARHYGSTQGAPYTPGADRRAQADDGTPYQVAGPTEALTEEQAQKAKADLEAHRAAPQRTDLPQLAPPGPDQGKAQSQINTLQDITPGGAAPVPRGGGQDVSIPKTLPTLPPSTHDAYDVPPEPGYARSTSAIPPAPEPGYLRSTSALPQQGPQRPPMVPPIGGGAGNVLQAPAPSGAPIGGGLGNVLQAPTGAPATVGRPPGELPSGYRGPAIPPTPSVGRPPGELPLGYRGPATPSTSTIPIGGGPGNVLQSPSGTPAANAPAPNAQPVSAVTPRVAPQSDPRFTQIYRPNAPAEGGGRGGGGPPMMTALDLSHLWGPNPPLSQRSAPPATGRQPGGRYINPQPPGGPPDVGMAPVDITGYPIAGVNAPQTRAQLAANPPMPPPRPVDQPDGTLATASARGGPIMRFQAGGGSSLPTTSIPGMTGLGTSAVASNGMPVAMDPWFSNAPGAGAPNAARAGFNAINYLGSQPNAPDPFAPGYQGTMSATQIGLGEQADFNALSPAQQAYYAEMSNPATSAYTYLSTPVPGATTTPAPTSASTSAPTPAPIVQPTATSTTAKPAVLNDPTTTTTSGAPGLPNQITAKSYNPNVDAQTGYGFANTSNTGGTNYSVGSNDLLNPTSAGTISGTPGTKSQQQAAGTQILSAKGGAIPPRPALRFQAGGGASPGMAAYMNSPTYVGPRLAGGWSGTPYAQLAPNQQQWADTTKGILGQELNAAHQDASYWGGGGMNPSGPNDTMQYWNQLTTMPNAVWPTVAAAPTPAPAPVVAPTAVTSTAKPAALNDPTTLTTSGAPGLPNSIIAKSYDPNVDAQTGNKFANTSNTGGTNYSVGSTDLLNATSPGTISGSNQQILSRKGGPITRSNVTPRVRYDDGGGVSPSIAGMPPGLSGAGAPGAPQIPPIYFNPATYAGTGAPVGKGVSQTSAPTYVAGAIPTLPMMRGGVVGYQEGGDVGAADDAAMMQSASSDDMMDARYEAEDEQAAAQAQAPAPEPKPGESDWYIQPSQLQAQASQPPRDPAMPQVKDDDGNPSKGFIGALTAGLHWLGDHFGLVAGAQAHPAIATDAQVQTNRHNAVTNNPDGDLYMDKATYEGAKDLQDPHHQLEERYRDIASMEGAYRWLMMQGKDKEAGQMAASMLHYAVMTSRQFAEQAAKELYDGNVKGAVDNINQASDAVPDGQTVHATLNNDGTVTITGSDMNGRAQWQQTGAAQAVLEHATSMARSGKLQWQDLESQAAKYDPTYAAAAKARAQNVTERQVGTAVAAAPQWSRPYQPTAAAGAPAPGIPNQPPATPAATTTTAPPGRTADSTGTAQTQQPPPTSDSSLAAKPAPGLPDQPTRTPVAVTQPVDPDEGEARDTQAVNAAQDNEWSQAQQAIYSKYHTPEGGIIYGGNVFSPQDPPKPTGVKATDKALSDQWKEERARYDEVAKRVDDAEKQELAAAEKAIDRKYTATMATVKNKWAGQRQERGASIAETGRQDTEKLKAQLADHNEVFKSNLAGAAPRSDQEMNSLVGENKTFDPYLGVARAFNPDLAESQDATQDRNRAMNDLKSKGFDANTQRTLASAYANGVRHSHNQPEETGAAIQGFVTGNDFHASAESVDAKGNPVPMHGVVRYDVSVVDNSGNVVSMRLPVEDLVNLRNLRGSYFRQTSEQGRAQTKVPGWYQSLDEEGAGAAPITMEQYNTQIGTGAIPPPF